MNLGIGVNVTTTYQPIPAVALDPDAAIAALFSSGEVGAWYDPSDSSTVFQDANGTTPAGVGDPVGLILDKSQGLTLGPELVDTANDATAWNPYGSNIVEQDGDAVKVTFVNDNKGANVFLYGVGGLISDLAAGTPYKLQFEAKINTGTANSNVVGLAVETTKALTSDYQTIQIIGIKYASTPYIRFLGLGAGQIGWVRNITVKELPGNHATQTTSAARPVLQQSGGLYYLDFDGVDDSLSTAAIDMTATDQLDVGVAIRRDRVGVQEFIAEFGYIYTDPGHFYLLHNSSATSNLEVLANGNIAGSASMLVKTTTASGSTHVVTSQNEIVSPTSTIRVDGVLSATNTANKGSGNFSTYPLFIGSRAGNTSRLDGAIYSYVMVNRTLTAAEITDLESYLASKSGVTL